MSTPPKSGLGVGDDRLQPVDFVFAFGVMNLVGTRQGLVDLAYHVRHRVDRIERLIRIHLPAAVGVGGNLPAGQINRLEAGLDLLHGLVACQRAQGIDERFVVQVAP